jgi:hypothetical protein
VKKEPYPQITQIPQTKKRVQTALGSVGLPRPVGCFQPLCYRDDPSITAEQWADGVRKYFKGQIIVGKDLMEI